VEGIFELRGWDFSHNRRHSSADRVLRTPKATATTASTILKLIYPLFLIFSQQFNVSKGKLIART